MKATLVLLLAALACHSDPTAPTLVGCDAVQSASVPVPPTISYGLTPLPFPAGSCPLRLGAAFLVSTPGLWAISATALFVRGTGTRDLGLWRNATREAYAQVIAPDSNAVTTTVAVTDSFAAGDTLRVFAGTTDSTATVPAYTTFRASWLR